MRLLPSSKSYYRSCLLDVFPKARYMMNTRMMKTSSVNKTPNRPNNNYMAAEFVASYGSAIPSCSNRL